MKRGLACICSACVCGFSNIDIWSVQICINNICAICTKVCINMCLQIGRLTDAHYYVCKFYAAFAYISNTCICDVNPCVYTSTIPALI